MSIEAMKFARDWIAEKPELRPCSAGKVVSMLTTAIAAAEKVESEKDALLRQALEALELPCDRWNAVQYRIVHDAIKAIRNHLGVKND